MSPTATCLEMESVVREFGRDGLFGQHCVVFGVLGQVMALVASRQRADSSAFGCIWLLAG